MQVLVQYNQYFQRKFQRRNFQSQMRRTQSNILGPLMCIKSNLDKGMRISWNFGGLIADSQYNCFHLFVFINTREPEASQLINKYYDKMKLGDLLGIFPRLNYKKETQKIKWAQKTSFELQQQFLSSDYILDAFESVCSKYLMNFLSKINGLIVINIIITGTKSEVKKKLIQLEKQIHNLRSTNQQSDKLVFNILGDFEKNILVNSLAGINLFRYQKYLMKPTITQIMNYLKIISIKKLNINLQIVGDVQCRVANSVQWKITQTSNIQKTYYAIPSCSFDQYLVFLLDKEEDKQLELIVTMQISFYNSKQIRAKNNVYHEISSLFKSYTINSSQNLYGKTKFANNDLVQTNLCERNSYFWLIGSNYI